MKTAVALRGYAILSLEERVHFLRPHLLGCPQAVIPRLVCMERVYLVEHCIAQPSQLAGRLEMMQEDLFHLFRTDVRIAEHLSLTRHHVDERHLVAGSHTGDWFEAHFDAQLTAGLPHSSKDRCRATGLTTVLHSQTHLALDVGLSIGRSMLRVGSLHLLKLVEHLAHLPRLHMSENLVVYLHHRSQRTTAQACHFLNGIPAVGSGDCPLWQFQLTHQRIIHAACALHMARRADAHLNDMLSVGCHAELRIEGGHAQQLGTVDVGPFVHTVQRFGRQIVELLLNGL